MAEFKINILEKENTGRIKNLVSAYKFNDYSVYRMLNKDSLSEYLFSQISGLFENKGNWVVTAEDKNKVVGLATLHFLPWDTKHLGIRTAKVGYLMAEGDYPQALAIKNKLLPYLFLLSKKEKIYFLSCRIDSDDISSIHALEKNGFNFMDTLVTYVFNRHKHNVSAIRDIYKIRKFRKQDLSILVDIARNVFSKDRFHLDNNIPKEKADSLFGEWVDNSYQGKYADRIFVAEKNKEAIGFLTFTLDKKLKEHVGYKICGHGLSAICPKIKGVYPALVKAAIQDIIMHFDCLEFDTQLNNYEVIKIWQKFGFDFLKARYTFHKWIK